jgi:hypothetical protein
MRRHRKDSGGVGEVKLMVLGNSSPRDDLRRDPVAVACKPSYRPGVGETSLQQYDGTDILQWHVKIGYEWRAVGPAMRIAT